MLAYKNNIARGISAALFSAMMLGMAPIFGKLAINAGMDTVFLVVLRTTFAALALWLIFGLFSRQYLYIYSVGLVACFTAGAINGLGSLMFYASLNYLDASLSQLLYATNPVILALLLRLDGQPISKLTAFRLAIALPAIFFITFGSLSGSTLFGVVLMLGGAFMYALHMAVNQRVLRDIPSPTVTLYTMTSMALVVVPSILWLRTPPSEYNSGAWQGLIGLIIVTLLSRLTLFIGMKRLGGIQTALLGLSELIISLAAAFILLNDSLTTMQWIGAVLLSVSVVLVAWERNLGKKHVSTGWLAEFYKLIDRQQLPKATSFDYQALLQEAANPDPPTVNPNPTAANPDPTTANPKPAAANPDPTAANPDPTAANPNPPTVNPDPPTANPAAANSKSAANPNPATQSKPSDHSAAK